MYNYNVSTCVKYVQLCEYMYKYVQLEWEYMYKVCTIRMWVHA